MKMAEPLELSDRSDLSLLVASLRRDSKRIKVESIDVIEHIT